MLGAHIARAVMSQTNSSKIVRLLRCTKTLPSFPPSSFFPSISGDKNSTKFLQHAKISKFGSKMENYKKIDHHKNQRIHCIFQRFSPSFDVTRAGERRGRGGGSNPRFVVPTQFVPFPFAPFFLLPPSTSRSTPFFCFHFWRPKISRPQNAIMWKGGSRHQTGRMKEEELSPPPPIASTKVIPLSPSPLQCTKPMVLFGSTSQMFLPLFIARQKCTWGRKRKF